MCVHLGIQHMVRERHSCPVPSVSVVAGSSRLSHRQTGGGRTTAPHKHNYTPRLRPVTQIQLHEPSQGPTIVPTHRGLARGQRVRRLSVDESVENEPGRSWSCATHTASVSVPRSRAENKSGPISSMWPAALPGSQPEKLLVRSLWSSQKSFWRYCSDQKVLPPETVSDSGPERSNLLHLKKNSRQKKNAEKVEYLLHLKRNAAESSLFFSSSFVLVFSQVTVHLISQDHRSISIPYILKVKKKGSQIIYAVSHPLSLGRGEKCYSFTIIF